MSRVLTDYHMHSISPDARVPMEAMCQAAYDMGLTEIAMTDHMEFYQPDYHSDETRVYCPAYVEQYFRSFEECRARFEGKLTLRCAVEMGQPHDNPTAAAALLQAHDYDFVIGSIHAFYNVDLSFKAYSETTTPCITKDYLGYVLNLAQTGDFDVLGHLDLVKRYAAHRGFQVDVLEHNREMVVEILKTIVSRGKGIEINTSGLRQGLGETLPSLAVLKLYRELGGEVLTIGSDAHRPQDVGADLAAARELALAAGFTRISTFARRQCSFYSIV